MNRAANNNKLPYVGALLRLGVMVARDRLLVGLSSRYKDLTAAHLPVFSYPFPDGVRPSQLALRTNQSKQSMNNVLSELERQGYVRRKALRSGGRRLVYLSPKGLKVVEICQREMLALQAELAKQVGQKRFDVFLGVLREFAAAASPMEVKAVPAASRESSRQTSRNGRPAPSRKKRVPQPAYRLVPGRRAPSRRTAAHDPRLPQ